MPKATDNIDKWIPIYIGDLLADTLHLSRADFGSYLLLIFAYWRRRGPLPDDDDALSEIARVAVRDWAPVRKVLAEFFQIGGGVWRHKRIDAELETAKRLHVAKSQAGKLGNAVRWGKRSQSDSAEGSLSDRKPIANGVANTIANDRPSPSPSPSTHIHNEAQPPNSSGQRLHGIPASVEEVIAYGQTINPKVSEEQCRTFWAHYEGQARTNDNGDIFWVTSGDAVITNWKVKLAQFQTARHETTRRPNKENPRNAGLSASADAGQCHADAFKRRTKQQ